MFSTTPSRRMFVFRAICAARTATCCEARCGVVTTTASARGRSWPSEMATSPVPGGMSTTSVSSSPQWTSERNCSSARWSMGPRHMTGVFSSRKKPIDITLRSPRTGGTIIARSPPSTATGRWWTPEHVRDRIAIDVGVEHSAPLPEASRTPRPDSPRATTCRRRPCRSRPRARACSSRPRSPASAGRRRRAAGRQRRLLLGRHHVEAELDLLDARRAGGAPSRPAPGSSRAAGIPARSARSPRSPGRRRRSRRAPCRARRRSAPARGRRRPRARSVSRPATP